MKIQRLFVTPLKVIIKETNGVNEINKRMKPHKALAQLFMDDYTRCMAKEMDNTICPKETYHNYCLGMLYTQVPNNKQVLFRVLYSKADSSLFFGYGGPDPQKFGIINFAFDINEKGTTLAVFALNIFSTDETRYNVGHIILDAVSKKLEEYGYYLELESIEEKDAKIDREFFKKMATQTSPHEEGLRSNLEIHEAN